MFDSVKNREYHSQRLLEVLVTAECALMGREAIGLRLLLFLNVSEMN